MPFDWPILAWVQTLRTPFGDWLMPFLSFLGEFGWVWVVLGLVLICIPRTRRIGVAVLLALVIDLVVTDLTIKNVIARPRPFEQNPAVTPLVDPPWGHSFPSGHTAAAFSAVFALYFSHARPGLWIPALVLACLIAFSRLYVYVHFPSDVVAGAIIGIFVGYVAVRAVNHFWPPQDAGPQDDGPPALSSPSSSS